MKQLKIQMETIKQEMKQLTQEKQMELSVLDRFTRTTTKT